MEYRVDAFRMEAEPASRATGPARPRRMAAIARGVALVAGLPLHLAAILLWWPIARVLGAAGVRRAAVDRVSRTLVD